jgi:preprotein translocase subunit SecA
MKSKNEDENLEDKLADELDEGDEIELFEPGITYKRSSPKIGRNKPCPCGSGKKFKKCHGK